MLSSVAIGALATSPSITAAVDLPVSADFMSGYGRQPEDVAESVTRCVETGVAGLSIEDATGDPASPLYELSVAVERVRAARQAIDQSGKDVLLTARAECYHVGHPDPFLESVRRLQAYAAAGADVLFAPGPQTPEEIKALVEAVAPKPLNLLVVRDIGLSVGGDRGARRATHQRRRRAGTGGVDRLHARRTDVEVEGQLRRTGEPGAVRRDQSASLPRISSVLGVDTGGSNRLSETSATKGDERRGGLQTRRSWRALTMVPSH